MSKLYQVDIVQPKSNRPGGLSAGSYLLSAARTVMIRPEGDNTLLRYRVKNSADVDPFPLEVSGDYLTVAQVVAEVNDAYSGDGFPVLVDRAGEDEELLVNFADVVCIEVATDDSGVLVVAPFSGRDIRYDMSEPVSDFLGVFADDSAELLVRGAPYDSRLDGQLLEDDSVAETGADEGNAIPLSVTIPADGSAAEFIPWTRNPYATTTAYADDGTGGGAYAALADSYDFSGANTTLWVLVTATDGVTELYYEVTVTVEA